MTDINQGLFWGYVKEGNIYNQINQQVGVTMNEYQKAIDTAKGFENILYEKGILVKPKTPEEINKELQETIMKQNEAMNSLLSSVSALTKKVEDMEKKKDGGQELNNESREQIVKTGKSGYVKQSL